jgi:membrane-associated phospholipid phosphatase
MLNESQLHGLKGELWGQRALAVISTAFFASFLLLAMFRESFDVINASVNLWASSVQTESFTFPAIIISNVFNSIPLLAISCLTATYLFMRKHWADGLLLLGALGVTALVVELAKILAHVARPPNGSIQVTTLGFPSGHTAESIVFCGVLVYLGWSWCDSVKARVSLCAAFTIIVLVVAMDRIYLNVHWLSDVIGGGLLGGFLLTASILAFQRWKGSEK